MTEPIELFEILPKVSAKHGFQSQEIGSVNSLPIYSLCRAPAPPSKLKLYLSSGIHGDEPASVQSTLSLLSSDAFPREWDVTICPIANPTGLLANTRENAQGIDLNRDFQNPRSAEAKLLIELIDRYSPFDLSICLHEDWEATGFYMYYMNPMSRELAETAVAAVKEVGPIDPATEIDGRQAQNGIIHPPSEFDPNILDGWPEAFYLYSKNRHQHFTLETPTALPMERRIEMAVTAVRAIIQGFELRK